MHSYIDRLLHCGWRLDNAYCLVEDFISEFKWDELEEFVCMEENAAKLKGVYINVQSTTK